MSQIDEILRERLVESQTRELPQATTRDVHVPRVLGKVLAVIGPRRAGKSVFLWQRLAERHSAGLPREALLYVDFEDDRLGSLDDAHLRALLDTFRRRTPTGGAWYLDEIQVVSGWETFVRRLIDTETLEVTISGSSAKMLSREVATSLRGRGLEVLVLPFSFREFLRHRGDEPDEPPEAWSRTRRLNLERAVEAWLTEGGFPEAQGLGVRDRFDLLRSYVDVALLRDVIDRHNVSNPVALRWLVRHLLGNAGGGFSVQKFVNDLRSQGLPVAKDTLHDYLSHLEDAFLVRTIHVATDSERRRMVNPRKAYPIDPGLIPVYDRSGKANLGHALETAILLELDRRGAETAYVKTHDGYEVDFLARLPGEGEFLIQACATAGDEETEMREHRALGAARAEHPRARAQIVTLAPETFRHTPAGVEVISAARWFLALPR
jgi:predicted AAA+ superfamily ATPase